MIKVLYEDKSGKERCFSYSDSLRNLAENMLENLEKQGIVCKLETTGSKIKRYDIPKKEMLKNSIPKLGIVKVKDIPQEKPASTPGDEIPIVKRKRGRPRKNPLPTPTVTTNKESLEIPD